MPQNNDPLGILGDNATQQVNDPLGILSSTPPEKKNLVGTPSQNGSQGLPDTQALPSSEPTRATPLEGLGGQPSYASKIVDISLNPPPIVKKHVLDGQPASRESVKRNFSDRSFVDAFVEGGHSVSINAQEDPELKAFVDRQINSRKTNDVWDSFMVSLNDVGKMGAGSYLYINDLLEEATGMPNPLSVVLTGLNPSQESKVGDLVNAVSGEKRKEVEAVLDKFIEQSEYSQEQRFKVEGDFIDQVKKGDVKEAVNMAINTTAESSIPSLLIGLGAAATGGGIGIAALAKGGLAVTPLFIGGEYADQLKSDDEAIKRLSTVNKFLRPAIRGGAEMAGEVASTAIWGGSMKVAASSLRSMVGQAAIEVGVEAAEQVAKEGGKQLAEQMLKSFAIDPLGEGVSELATYLAQESTDQLMGISNKTMPEIAREGLNSFALGFASGQVMTTPANVGTAIKMSAEGVRASKKFFDESISVDPSFLTDLNEAVDRMPVSEEQKESIKENVAKREKAVKAVPKDMVEDTETVDLVEEKQAKKEQAKGLDPIFAAPIEEEIAEIDAKLSAKVRKEYPAPKVNTTPTETKYASVNRNDGKGTVELTQEEYLAEMERRGTPVEESSETKAKPKAEPVSAPPKEESAPVKSVSAPPLIESLKGTPVKDLSEDVAEGVFQTEVDGVDVLMSEVDDNTVKLESIRTPEAARGQGKAKAVLAKITAKADELGKTIVLDVVPEGDNATESVESTAKALDEKDLSKMPNVSWHGSKNRNLIFGKPKDGKTSKSNMQLDFGTHFTNEDYASFYEGDKGRKYPAIIDLKSSLDLTQGMWWKDDANFEKVYQLIKDLKLEKSYGSINFIDKNGNRQSDIQGASITAHKLTELPPKRVSDALKKNGFDGIIYEPYHPKGGKYYEAKPKSFIVLDNSSIKEPTPKNISEAYHKAKADGSNPELVDAVESALGVTTETGLRKLYEEAGFVADGKTSMRREPVVISEETIGDLPYNESFKDVKEEDLVRTETIFKKKVDESSPYDGMNQEARGKMVSENKLISSNESVDVSKIIPTQEFVNGKSLKRKTDKKPIIAKWKGNYHVLDGHHRIASDILGGKKTVDATVIDFDKAPQEKPESKIEKAPIVVSEEKVKQEEDYRGAHTAPRKEGLNTLDDPTDMFGDDIYSPQAARYFGHGDKAMDEASARKIQSFKGKPDAEVTIYRAVPKGVKDINAGDWVTINKKYAQEHGESHIDGEFDIIEKKVKAKELTTDANSIHEWGYSPEETTQAETVEEVDEDILSLEDLRSAMSKVVSREFIESPEGQARKLARTYTNMGKRGRKTPLGVQVFADLQKAVKDNGYTLQPNKTGGFTVLDKNGKPIKKSKAVSSKEEKAEKKTERKEVKETRSAALMMNPISIEHWVAQRIASGTRFKKSELLSIVGENADIPAWMWAEKGLSLEGEEFLEQLKGEGFTSTLGELEAKEKAASEIAKYAHSSGRKEAIDYVEKVYEESTKETDPYAGYTEEDYLEIEEYRKRVNLAMNPDLAIEIMSLEFMPEDVAQHVLDNMKAQEEYESSTQYLSDIQKQIKDYEDKQKGKRKDATGKKVDGDTSEAAKIAKRLRDKKIGGVSFVDPLFGAIGISKSLYDGALELAARQVEKGTKLGTAIANAIKYIDERMAGKKWDKGLFGRHLNDQFKMTVAGKEVEVKRDLSEETLEVVNGWYSPLEKSIKDTKADSLTAKEWLDKVRSKEGEDLWTGLRGMLEAKSPKDRVSKRELLNFLKDNRVDVVEVVKGTGSPQIAFEGWSDQEVSDHVVDEMGADPDEVENMGRAQMEAWAAANADFDYAETSDVKFSQYQLEGEKENYKEVLVTLPAAKSKQEYVVEQDYRIPNTFYAVNQKTGVKLKFGSYELAKSQAERLSKEAQPDFDKQFKSSHFDEPNILVHLRMNTRKDADGNKVLFLEEVQSDWGQKGKREGFAQAIPTSKEAIEARDNVVRLNSDLLGAINDMGIPNGWTDANEVLETIVNENGEVDFPLSAKVKSLLPKYLEAQEKASKYNTTENVQRIDESKKVSSAPFVTDTNSWVKLGVKVALKEAVAQGVDKIAWTTGEQQNERYSLEKQVDRIQWNPWEYGPKGKGTRTVLIDMPNGEVYSMSVDSNGIVARSTSTDSVGKRLDSVIGKEIADKIMSDERGDLSGDGLKLGGKGMKGFYGSPKENSKGILGSVVESITGQKVGKTRIDAGDYSVGEGNYVGGVGVYDSKGDMVAEFDSKKEADEYIDKQGSPSQPSIEITPELKAAVKKGQPLFGSNLGLEKARQELKDAWKAFKDEGKNLGFADTPENKGKRLADLDEKLAKALINFARKYIAAVADKAKVTVSELLKAFTDAGVPMTKRIAEDVLDVVVPPSERLEKPKVKRPEQSGVKKTVQTKRAYEGNIRQEVKDFLEENGLTRMSVSMEKQSELAKEFIDKYGEDVAIEAVRNGDVTGGQAASIIAQVIKSIDEQMSELTSFDSDELSDLSKRQSEAIILLGDLAYKGGAFNAQLAFEYENSDIGYNVEKKISEYKDRFGEIEEEVEKKFREWDSERKDLKKKLAKAIEAAEKAQEKAAIEAIKGLGGRPSVTYKQRAKRVADDFRKLKTKPLTFTDSNGNKITITEQSVISWNALIEVGAKAIELTGEIADGVKAMKDKLSEADWFTKLSKKDQEAVLQQIDDHFYPQVSEETTEGPIRISKTFLRELVENGVDNIEDLVAAVKEAVQDEYPDITDREVRDAITQYGKTINIDRDSINKELRRLKEIGRIISQLEDVADKKRPVRSGIQREKFEAEQEAEIRALKKQLREAMKDLPVDSETEARQLATSLDAAKNRVKNQIEDLQREIDRLERIDRKGRSVKQDAELTELIERRDAIKAVHEEAFKNDEKATQQKINAAIRAIERSIEEYDRRISEKELEAKKKPSPIASAEIAAAKKQLEERKAFFRQMQEDAGIVEKKRLELAKNRTKARIKELERRIADRDFQKTKPKPLKEDAELLDLQAELLRVNEKFDKEFHKKELENRTKKQKTIDAIWDAWGLTRVLMATGEASFVGIQGGIMTISHPLNAIKAFKNSIRFLTSEKKTEEWLRKVKSEDYYPALKKSKLALTEPHARLTAREELYYSDWAEVVWKMISFPLKFISESARNNFIAANPIKAIERAAIGYLDTHRLLRYLDGVEVLESQGKTFESNPQDYKDVADAINTLTGRASLGDLELFAETLSKVFFSPRNWASQFKTATPYALYHFGKMTPTARKMAIADFSKFVGITTGFVMMAAAALNGDDDDETGVEFDPRSSDFMKIKIGDRRIDPWGGRIQQIVLSSRIIMEILHDFGPKGLVEGGMKKPSGEVIPLGTPYKSPTMLNTGIQMAINKLSPSAHLLTNYMETTENKEGVMETPYGEVYSPTDDIKSSLKPIFWETVNELIIEDPSALNGLITAGAFFGVNANVYDSSKIKKGKSETSIKELRKEKDATVQEIKDSEVERLKTELKGEYVDPSNISKMNVADAREKLSGTMKKDDVPSNSKLRMELAERHNAKVFSEKEPDLARIFVTDDGKGNSFGEDYLIMASQYKDSFLEKDDPLKIKEGDEKKIMDAMKYLGIVERRKYIQKVNKEFKNIPEKP